MIRIGIVNDLRLAVEALKRAVATLPGATVAWVAMDGAQAVDMCAKDRPDVVLMDMIMPVMDGVEATRRIMKATPCPIIVVTATVEGNSAKVFEALGAGALDAVATPRMTPDGAVQDAESLVRKIQIVNLISGAGPTRPAPAAPARSGGSDVAPLVAIGVSTGGPQALAVVLKALPRPVPWGVVIVQHIDESFAAGLADWLIHETGHQVQAARGGDIPAPGRIFLAATNDHVMLDSGGRLAYTPEPREMAYRPSVDVFFDSILAARAAPGVAVVLTGMGRDGAQGLARLRAAGWHTIAQDKETSVVWGMPAAAAQLGAAVQVLPISAVGAAIVAGMSVRNTAPGRRP